MGMASRSWRSSDLVGADVDVGPDDLLVLHLRHDEVEFGDAGPGALEDLVRGILHAVVIDDLKLRAVADVHAPRDAPCVGAIFN